MTESHTLIDEIRDLIDSDDNNKESDSLRLIYNYRNSDGKQKDAIDLVFTNLCGYSLATIISSLVWKKGINMDNIYITLRETRVDHNSFAIVKATEDTAAFNESLKRAYANYQDISRDDFSFDYITKENLEELLSHGRQFLLQIDSDMIGERFIELEKTELYTHED